MAPYFTRLPTLLFIAADQMEPKQHKNSCLVIRKTCDKSERLLGNDKEHAECLLDTEAVLEGTI